MSHSAQKFRRGSIYCITNFGDQKILCIRGLCHVFFVENFLIRSTKNFLGELFCTMFQEFECNEKVYGQETAEYQYFPSQIFCLAVPKEKFVREPLSLSLNSSIEKFYA